MRTAIVNITCPHCGGRVDAIDSTVGHQKLGCPYCRTELHVPRVGEPERVEYEYEVVRTPAPDTSITPESHGALGSVIVVAMLALGVVILLAGKSSERDRQTDQRNQIESCERTCKTECGPEPVRPLDAAPFGAADQEYLKKASEQGICTLDCELHCGRFPGLTTRASTAPAPRAAP